jgi:multicomponent Na+:H+ antiporter subunit E
MQTFLWNLFLALIWASVLGDINPVNLAAGFVIGYFVLRFLRPASEATTYFDKVGSIVRFLLFFIWEVVKSNIRVAYDVVTPTHHMRPGIVAIPLEARTDFEILFLANLITLTPGTLSLDVSADRKVLYVHAWRTATASGSR